MRFKNKIVTVCGGTGFIGLNVVKGLLKTDVAKVIVTSHTKRPYYYDDILSDSRIEHHVCDLTTSEHCDKVTKESDYVVISNAVSFGALFIQNNPLGLVNDNIIMNVRLLDACMKNGVERVVYYGSTTGYPDTSEEMVEDDMFTGDPHDKYYSVGWMKRYTEVLLKLYAEKLNILSAAVLRLSNVYGPYDKFDPDTSHVLPAMVKKFGDEQFPLEVWGDGTDSRDLIYVEDVVEATLLALENVKGFQALNIGSGINHTVNDIINILKKVKSVEPELVYLTDKPRMIAKRVVNVDKAAKILNFKPVVDIDSGLKMTMEWYLNNKEKIYR